MAYKIFFRTIVCLAFLLILSETNLACMYGQPLPSVCELYSESESVILGEVKKFKSSTGESDTIQTATIAVLKSFKGKKLKQILLNHEVSACEFRFNEEKPVGRKYVLYLKRNPKTGKLEIYSADSGETRNLVWLDGLPNSLKRTAIFGQIKHRDSKSYLFDFVKNIVGARVKIFDEKNAYEVFTDEKGRYFAWDLPAGKYKVAPEYPAEYGLRSSLTYGPVEFRQIGNDRVDTADFTVEAASGMCGGVDFIVDFKENLRKKN